MRSARATSAARLDRPQGRPSSELERSAPRSGCHSLNGIGADARVWRPDLLGCAECPVGALVASRGRPTSSVTRVERCQEHVWVRLMMLSKSAARSGTKGCPGLCRDHGELLYRRAGSHRLHPRARGSELSGSPDPGASCRASVGCFGRERSSVVAEWDCDVSVHGSGGFDAAVAAVPGGDAAGVGAP